MTAPIITKNDDEFFHIVISSQLAMRCFSNAYVKNSSLQQDCKIAIAAAMFQLHYIA